MERNIKCRLAAVMILFGSIGLFVRYIPLPSAVTALARGLIGTLFLVGFSFIRKEKPSGKAIKENLPLLMLSGAAIGINWVCLFEAYRYTTIATATVCYYLAPIFVIIGAMIFCKERLSLKKAFCVAAAFFGTGLVSGIFTGDGGGSPKALLGIVFGITAAFFYATVILMNKAIKNISAKDATMTQLFAASAILLPYVLLTGGFTPGEMTGRGYFLLLVVGILHTGAAYAVYFSCIPKLKSQTVAVFGYLDPAAAILLSAVCLRERLSMWEWIGALLILGAAFLGERAGEEPG